MTPGVGSEQRQDQKEHSHLEGAVWAEVLRWTMKLLGLKATNVTSTTQIKSGKMTFKSGLATSLFIQGRDIERVGNMLKIQLD